MSVLRPTALVSAIALLATGAWATADAQPTPRPSPVGSTVVVEGAGTAHGMGLAMDGVLGQARSGWSYDRILSLFYKDTERGHAGGTIRVGLAESGTHTLELPGGGTVSDAPSGGSGPFPMELPAGARVIVRHIDGRYVVEAPGVIGAAQLPVETPEPPSPEPSATPAPSPEPSAEAPPGDGLTSEQPIWITPAGEPALTRVQATGRRYRGRMEVRLGPSGGLWAVNHVDLETYVQGIAEEKGAGWPVEGLKVLAVASRTLAAATMSWYTKHHPKGFDICPTSQCQVYLGYDGEEPSMRQATRETAGEIRTWSGRPILAMYHGNGGGQTDSYRLMYGNGLSDPHPYLSSVRYPHANPKTWRVEVPVARAKALLAAKGYAVPGELSGFEVLERGDSPRVRKLRVVGTEGSVELAGITFQGALDLPSAWFDPRIGEAPPAAVAIEEPPVERGRAVLAAPRPRPARPAAPEPADGRPWRLIAVGALLAAAAAAGARARAAP